MLAGDDVAGICAIGRQRRLDVGTLRGAAAHEADPAAVDVSVLALADEQGPDLDVSIKAEQ